MAAAAACRPSLLLRCSTSWDSNFSVERTAHPGRMKTPDLHLQVQRRCQCYDMFDQLVPYVEAWRWQKSLVDARCAALSQGEQQCEDTLLMLQHPPVYTMGTRSSDEYLRFDKDDPPFELHRTERGGEVTYHGPGQLVMYPILDLRRHRQDLHWYLRALEEVVIRALWTACGLVGSRVEGLTGVWVGNAKVAAVGVRVSRWLTYHGLALNVNTDLTPFQRIVPCGIADRPVGSIAQILSPQQLNEEQSGALLGMVHEHLLEAFSDVFDLDLVPISRPSLGEPRTVTSDLCDRTSTTM